MSKYYAHILGATCFIAALQHSSRRSYFCSASPYISMSVTVLLCMPHIVWLFSHGAPPLRYLSSISGRGFDSTTFYAAKTFFGSLAQHGVVFLVIAIFAQAKDVLRRFIIQWGKPQFRLLTIFAIGPLLLTVIAAFVLRTKISTNMLIGTFSLLPLFAMEISGIRNIERFKVVVLRLAVALSFGALFFSLVIAFTRACFSNAANDTQPRKELAVAATKLWIQKTGRPLLYVAGSDLYGTGVAFYSSERPHGFIHFDLFRNQWVTPEAIAENGLLSVCVKNDTDCLALTHTFSTPQATQTEITLTHDFWGHKGRPVSFVVTVIPSRSSVI